VNSEILAVLLMGGGMSTVAISFLFPSEHKFHPVTTSLVRGFANTLISYLLGRKQGADMTYPSSHNLKWLFIRNGIMVLQCLAHAWVQFYLPLPIVLTLMASSPIFTAIFDKVINGVHLNRAQVFWLSIAFLGVVLAANGTYLWFLMTGR
jgi:drug/metabolite transporter (DMT)-like permease